MDSIWCALHTVVGRILLAADEQFGMKELAVLAGFDLINWLHPELARNINHGIPMAPAGMHTEGSKSTKIERGTYFPDPVSVKNVS